MADFFGAIATKSFADRTGTLRTPEPVKDNGVVMKLSKSGTEPVKVAKKMSTKSEIDKEVEKLRKHYLPFMSSLSHINGCRSKQILSQFAFQDQTDGINTVSSLTAGEGEWKDISVPEYGGPIGSFDRAYRTVFTFEKSSSDKKVFIHFDGVDYSCEVYLNGIYAGSHEGFFAPFEFEITDILNARDNILLVVVHNDYCLGGNPSPINESIRIEGEKVYAATGFGYDDPETGWHHCPAGMGICQKVWIEERNPAFLGSLFVRPVTSESAIETWSDVFSANEEKLGTVKLSYSLYGENFTETVFENKEYVPMAETGAADGVHVYGADFKNPVPLRFFEGNNTVKLSFPLENYRLWTPDEPYLYRLVVELYIDGKLFDSESTVFGMRSFTEDTDNTPKGMFYLNGKPIRLRGANTMGFEQQDVLKEDFDQLLYDLLLAKACHMNFLRITQRPVQHEIYEMCDRIGLMLQTDLPLFTVVRRTKVPEIIRQAEEMEKLIRTHPCCILSSFINEPMANGDNRPHRHLSRSEMEEFFTCCRIVTKLQNPDRVIKNIDGDYDAPDLTSLPDNHCYNTWYNGHGIDIGKQHRGYWVSIADGWYYGCGEFGAEGLDPADLMRRRYPASWLPRDKESEKNWTPSRIKGAQSGNMHYFFYDTQDSLEKWVKESRNYQAFATKMQTSAFRRDSRCISFAIHLFIDAFPSGWMKTIVDCERNPKPAFFTYRDCLEPLMVSVRTDRFSAYSGEELTPQIFVCNDTNTDSDGHRLHIELIDSVGKLISSYDGDTKFGACTSTLIGKACVKIPDTDSREKVTMRAILEDRNGNVIHYDDAVISVFPKPSVNDTGNALIINGKAGLESSSGKICEALKNGTNVLINGLEPGEYSIAGNTVRVKGCGMRPLHFVSRKTGHALVKDFEPDDFSYWYDEKEDRITPIIAYTFEAEGFVPILTSGNCDAGSAWGKPLHKVMACAEKKVGKAKLIVNEVLFDSHKGNPVADIMKDRLSK